MNKLVKFCAISLGGLLALMVIAMIVAAVTGANPQEVKDLDLIREWMWYRIGAYALILLAWSPVSRLLTLPKTSKAEMSNQDFEKIEQKREQDRTVIVRSWWKVAALFAFFEIVIIQQFGL